MRTRERIAAIRLMKKLEHNTEFSEKIGVSFRTKRQSFGSHKGKEEKAVIRIMEGVDISSHS